MRDSDRGVRVFARNPEIARGLQAALARSAVRAELWTPNEPLDAGEVVLVAIDQWNWQNDLELSRQVVGASATYLRLGHDSNRVWLGPSVAPGCSRCARCMRTWLRNNHPEKGRWAQIFETDGTHEPAQNTWWAARDLIAALVAASLDRGQDVAEAFDLAGAVAVFDSATGELTRHPIFPDPGCSECSLVPDDSAHLADITWSSRPKPDPRTFRQRNDRLNLSTLEKMLVDWRTGLIKHLFQDTNSDLLPLVATEQPVLGEEDVVEAGYGRAETVEQSRRVAILESLERFVGHAPRRTRTVVHASFKEVGAAGIDPRLFVLHDPEQAAEPGFACKPYDDDLRFNWVWGYSFARRGPVMVPEQLVYYRLQSKPGRPVNRFVYETSSGCALGGSLEEASLYGLLELIERDAYMTRWYGQMAPHALDPRDAKDPNIMALIARAEGAGFQIHLFDMSLEFGPPAIWALLLDPKPDAPVSSYCAAGAHPDPERAIFSALVEVLSSIGVYEKTMPALRSRAYSILRDHHQLQDMHDHVLLYSLPEAASRLNFLFDGAPAAPLRASFRAWYEGEPHGDLLQDLETVVQAVLAVAEDVIVVNQSYSGLDELGLSAVRVLAPGLMPVTFGHQYRRINLDRINRAAIHLKNVHRYEKRDLNQHPHNFP